MRIGCNMENIDIIDQLINGIQTTETVKIKYNNEEYSFTLRPLTSGELAKLQNIERKGLNIKPTTNKHEAVSAINAGEMAKNQAEAMHTGISMSLDAPLEKVQMLPIQIVEQLFKEIIRISKLTDKELILVQNFQ